MGGDDATSNVRVSREECRVKEEKGDWQHQSTQSAGRSDNPLSYFQISATRTTFCSGGNIQNQLIFLCYFTLSNNGLLPPASCLLKVECLLSLAFLIWFLQHCAISCYFFCSNPAKFCFGGTLPCCFEVSPEPSVSLLVFCAFVGTLCSGPHGTTESASCYLGPISVNKYLPRTAFTPMLFQSLSNIDTKESEVRKSPQRSLLLFQMRKLRAKE